MFYLGFLAVLFGIPTMIIGPIASVAEHFRGATPSNPLNH
jgi:hypothetical protein